MNKSWISTIGCGVAGAVFCVGLFSSLLSLSRYSSVKQQEVKSVAAFDRLDALEREFKSLDAVVSAFDALKMDALVDPKALVTSAFGSGNVKEVRQSAEACHAAYNLNCIEIHVKDVPLTSLLPFLSMSESHRPPLRLAACTIHASDLQSGQGDVVVKLERIEGR